ncbi:MAG: hypothetical protein LRS48_04955 [Desulfurococcales archaeon]|nr:hypothetical protein [Desulfurococcales archaeon]
MISLIPVPNVNNVHDIYTFSVYVAFPVAILVFIAGFIYRIGRLYMAHRRKKWLADHAKVGIGTLILGLINVFVYPPLFASARKKKDVILGMTSIHFIGLIPLIFLLAQHVAFFSYYIPGYHYLWPFYVPLSATTAGLPAALYLAGLGVVKANIHFTSSIWGPLTIILNGDFLFIVASIAVAYKLGERIVLWAREGHRPSDAIMLAHLLAILLTGAMAAHHQIWSATTEITAYRLVLGTHILLAALFLALIPFTKYWHFVFGMWYGKLIEWTDRTWMRGAALEGGRLTPVRSRKRGE